MELWKTDSPALQVNKRFFRLVVSKILLDLRVFLPICAFYCPFVSKIKFKTLQVPEAILIQTLEKGTEGLAMRRKEEYHLWQKSKN